MTLRTFSVRCVVDCSISVEAETQEEAIELAKGHVEDGMLVNEEPTYTVTHVSAPEDEGRGRMPNDCPECARSFGPHYTGPCEH